MSRPFICNDHAAIEELVDEIDELVEDTTVGKLFRRRIISRTKKVRTILRRAIESGQLMEDRLQEYYNAIVELGFERCD